jgi:hypothetical protein
MSGNKTYKIKSALTPGRRHSVEPRPLRVSKPTHKPDAENP